MNDIERWYEKLTYADAKKHSAGETYEYQENVINPTESVIEDNENVIDAEYTEVADESTETEEICFKKQQIWMSLRSPRLQSGIISRKKKELLQSMKR